MDASDEFDASGEYRVKGSSIRSKLVYLAAKHGRAAEQQLEEWLRERGAWPMLEATWYPFELYDQVLRFIADRFFDGDVRRLHDVGRFSSRQALTTTYDVFRRELFRDFLAKSPTLHCRHYSHGQAVAPPLMDDADGCSIQLSGAPVYPETDLYVSAGFYAGAAELMGHEGVRCGFKHQGDRVHLLLRWDS